MRQIVQDLKSGKTYLEEVPVPRPAAGMVLIRTRRSLVSLGTEKMLVGFARAGLVDKARQQPERVREVIRKMKTDGLLPTMEAVYRKLGTPLPLGYSQAGEVIAVGEDVPDFRPGDRVVSNGPHAEVAAVPKNLVASIPDGVSWDQACFTVVGAIGLQGIRLVKPSFGETVVVIGLGLIGLITAQLLRAGGCRVVGFDVDGDKLAMAERLDIAAFDSGVHDPVEHVMEMTGGLGADAVIISASSKSDEIIRQAARMSRKRGRIVLTGVVGLKIDRNDFYEKELTFQVSCSYGPGRYDPEYELKGHDYPPGFVRWTEKRNFEAVLEALRNGSLQVDPLITERVPLQEYHRIYGDMEKSRTIAAVLAYPGPDDDLETGLEAAKTGQDVEKVGRDADKVGRDADKIGRDADKAGRDATKAGPDDVKAGPDDVKAGQDVVRSVQVVEEKSDNRNPQIAIIGAGNFTSAVILPVLKKIGVPVRYLVSSGGLSSTTLARKYGVTYSSTDYEAVLGDDAVTGVFITTRHHQHAPMVVEALRAGKEVFVEKPLAITPGQLGEVIRAASQTERTVMVGFNRRFSPFATRMKALLGDSPGPMNLVATVNAGRIPADSWIQDPGQGGGRIIGEACHFIDLLSFLAGSDVLSVTAQSMDGASGHGTDNVSIHLQYAGGALGVVNYLANGSPSYAKERLEVHHRGRTLVLDNFRRLKGYGFRSRLPFSHTLLKSRQDKGHRRQFADLLGRWNSDGPPLIPFSSLVNTTRATFAALESLELKKTVAVQPFREDPVRKNPLRENPTRKNPMQEDPSEKQSFTDKIQP